MGPDKPGRAVDDGKVKAAGASDKPGRTADEQKAAKKKSKKAKATTSTPAPRTKLTHRLG